jgi:hypothetical protein
VTYVAHAATDRNVIDLSNLNGLRRGDKTLTRPLIVLHPYAEQDCDLLREIVALESVARLFVIVWSPRDLVRTWLDGVGAVNLHTRSALGAPDVVQLEAAKCWVDEQYNGLSSGSGKDAVVQLLRLFSAAGYPLDADTWCAPSSQRAVSSTKPGRSRSSSRRCRAAPSTESRRATSLKF